jgi:hypothetical protein
MPSRLMIFAQALTGDPELFESIAAASVRRRTN